MRQKFNPLNFTIMITMVYDLLGYLDYHWFRDMEEFKKYMKDFKRYELYDKVLILKTEEYGYETIFRGKLKDFMEMDNHDK